MTYRIAMAAGQDAGNRNARRNGRSVWNAADRNIAAQVANRLMELVA